MKYPQVFLNGQLLREDHSHPYDSVQLRDSKGDYRMIQMLGIPVPVFRSSLRTHDVITVITDGGRHDFTPETYLNILNEYLFDRARRDTTRKKMDKVTDAFVDVVKDLHHE